jgi:hypothetical protein
MQAAAGSVGELEVGEDEEDLLSYLSLSCLIVLEMSDPESNSDSTGVGALGCLCASGWGSL